MCSTMDPNVGVITAATPREALLYNRNFVGQPNPVFCIRPALNPDGSQMTLSQFNRASGRAIVNCFQSGTLALLSFSGPGPMGCIRYG